MAKRTLSRKQPELILDQHAPEPLYRQLYERLRAGILAGQLESGTRLPSTRALASELGISRTTTALAYAQLLLEGYVESRVGDGTRVARLPAEQLGPGSRAALAQGTADTAGPQPAPLGQRGHALGALSFREERYADWANARTRPFRISQPDVAHFPYAAWARLVARHARRSLPAMALYQNAHGYAPLREAIAAYIGLTRGVHCAPDQIILTAGSQGALDLIARVVLDPGDLAWVEDPGYSGARGALVAAGAHLLPVPVDQEGLVVAAGRQLGPAARLAIVTPSHQFPTAVTMSLRRRLELLDWSREAQAWIVEDDYDSEYRYGGRPLEALHGLDSAGRVIYVGTFSKVLLPSSRLGYLVAPPALLQALRTARRFIDIHPPVLEQMALADFMAEGHYARYVRKMRLLYRERRDALVDALRQELGDLLDVAVPEAGMHLVAWLRAGLSAEAVAVQAAAHGLQIPTMSRFSLRPLQRDGLMLGFAGADRDELRAGVHTLARAIRTS
jgi:GntR family transcriptional regulator/MocR family aminotransferase